MTGKITWDEWEGELFTADDGKVYLISDLFLDDESQDQYLMRLANQGARISIDDFDTHIGDSDTMITIKVKKFHAADT